MSASRVITLLVVAGLIAAGVWWRWLRPPQPPAWLGYVESETLYLAAPTAGRLTSLPIPRGGRLAAGQTAFTLDPTTTGAKMQELQAAMREAQARLDDLLTGRRPQELAVTQARAEALAAQEEYAAQEERRATSLFQAGVISQSAFERAQSDLRASRASRRAAAAEDNVGRLPARAQQIAAARATVAEIQAQIRAQTRLSEEIAPTAVRPALVQQTYFNPGEWVPANAPVVALQEDGRLKVRFFVPEPQLQLVKVGARIRIRCDGCAHEVAARVDYVSPQAEFTPPVIYSDQARAKLVFQVEAHVADPQLLAGLPVKVGLRS